MSTFPFSDFPIFLLQNSIKVSNDPPKGVKKNMQLIYTQIISSINETNFYNSCEKMYEWRKLFLSLAFFHSIIIERKRFGPIGWNLPYNFNHNDFDISMK